MSDPTQPSGDLQFDKVEGTGGTPTCSECHQPIRDAYYDVNGRVLCERCRRAAEAKWTAGSTTGGFGRALGLGVLAAVAGTAIYHGVGVATGRRFSIIAIVVGFLVGTAVRKGANGRGGWKYQSLALFLTYSAIVFSYVPLTDLAAIPTAGPLALLSALGYIYELPFLAGFDNIFGLVIIAIGLFEAWKLNQLAELRIAGPFKVGGPASPTA